MNRRGFLKLSAATVASTVLLPTLGIEANAGLSAKPVVGMDMATFGNFPNCAFTLYVSEDYGATWQQMNEDLRERLAPGMTEPPALTWSNVEVPV